MAMFQLGLDTFGDVTVDAQNAPQSQARTLRHVIEQAVVAEQVPEREAVRHPRVDPQLPRAVEVQRAVLVQPPEAAIGVARALREVEQPVGLGGEVQHGAGR